MGESKDLSNVRRDYESTSIGKADLDADPIVEFGKWLQQATDLQLIDSTAMTLATATNDGLPSARIVLLKGYDADGFCWYTDSRSQKGQELECNPQAALLFHWRDLSRQIRVQGSVERLSAEQADSYFHSRPEGSRFSAASSWQTSPVESRAVLESEVQRLRDLHPQGDVPRPEAWIGYRLKPVYFEFWQGLVNRLHDRIVYRPAANGWAKSRISP
ncbi:MAG: pyridoxamine 5'-phosphate oxidase [Gammaproteobacteria bacterium]|nr:pyridoxamine 5'-phosphate oxidase [Gammaproteobacteria bacterium]